MTTVMLDSYDPVKNSGGLCRDFTTDGFPIRLYQHRTRKERGFAVQYGKQFDIYLTYSEACKKLGEALMHDAACRGELDNERD
jgi:hypothetical protein